MCVFHLLVTLSGNNKAKAYVSQAFLLAIYMKWTLVWYKTDVYIQFLFSDIFKYYPM